MTEISASLVKDLREKTGAGMMECKKALTESSGDLEKAIDYLRKRGIAQAAKRAGKETMEGMVGSYIHAGGKIGVLVELNCETDFVAKTPEFTQLVKEVAMHIAASNPLYLQVENVPEEIINREKSVFADQAKNSGKPEKAWEAIISGKLKKFYSEVCLLEQPFVRDPDKTISILLKEAIAKFGENINVRRFSRFQLGSD